MRERARRWTPSLRPRVVHGEHRGQPSRWPRRGRYFGASQSAAGFGCSIQSPMPPTQIATIGSTQRTRARDARAPCLPRSGSMPPTSPPRSHCGYGCKLTTAPRQNHAHGRNRVRQARGSPHGATTMAMDRRWPSPVPGLQLFAARVAWCRHKKTSEQISDWPDRC